MSSKNDPKIKYDACANYNTLFSVLIAELQNAELSISECLTHINHASDKFSGLIDAFEKKQARALMTQYALGVLLTYLHKSGHKPSNVQDDFSFFTTAWEEVFNSIHPDMMNVWEKSPGLGLLGDNSSKTRNSFPYWGRAALPVVRLFTWTHIGKTILDVVHKLNEYYDADSSSERVGGIANIAETDQNQEYDRYINQLERRLREYEDGLDLIMLDCALIGEYESKGVIDSIESTVDKANFYGLGQSVMGIRNALPIIRNYHMPATVIPMNAHNEIPKEIRKAFTDESEETDEIDFLTKQPFRQKLWWSLGNRSFNNNFGKYPFSSLSNANDNTPFLQQPFPLILNMGECYPYIPMQLAAGAHAAYSAYAYLAGASPSGPHPGVVIVDPIRQEQYDEYQVSIGKPERLADSTKMFVSLCFFFVPFISFIFDQRTSHEFREYSIRNGHEYWFDPCLPIESIALDGSNDKIEWKKRPFSHKGMFLTCLGGFALAVVARSIRKDAAKEVAARFVEGIHSHPNCNKVKTKHGSNVFSEKDELLDEIGKHFSSRPAFRDWTEIESAVSDATRLFAFVSICARAIYCEAVILHRDREKAKTFEKLNLTGPEEVGNILNDMKRMCTTEAIESYIGAAENQIRVFLCSSKGLSINGNEAEEKILRNIGGLRGEATLTAAILRDCLDKINNNNDYTEEFLDLLGDRFAHFFVDRITGVCRRKNLKVLFHDHVILEAEKH